MVDEDASMRTRYTRRLIIRREYADTLMKASPASPTKLIRLLIADADPVFRQGLAAVLDGVMN
jgi:hypothetical protein